MKPHGYRGTATYNAWSNLLQRHKSMCPRWATFPPFLEDMGFKPDGTILRKRDDGKPASKDNCAWVKRGNENAPYYKHGKSRTKTYKVWAAMVQRTSNPNCRQFDGYGGRGVTLCPEWRSYDNFYRDMGDAPEGLTLERIDNDRGYCKENCKWATRREQTANRRVTVRLPFRGELRTVREIAEALAVPTYTVYNANKKGKLSKLTGEEA